MSFHVCYLPLRAVGQPYPSGSCAYGVSAHPFSCVRPRGGQYCHKRNFALRLRAAYVLFQSPVCRNCAAISTAFHRSRCRLRPETPSVLRSRCVCIPDSPRACSAGTVSVRSCRRCVRLFHRPPFPLPAVPVRCRQTPRGFHPVWLPLAFPIFHTGRFGLVHPWLHTTPLLP